MDDEDTGTIAEVAPERRLNIDAGEGSDATEGGLDDDGLDAVYADPGAVVPEEDLA